MIILFCFALLQIKYWTSSMKLDENGREGGATAKKFKRPFLYSIRLHLSSGFYERMVLQDEERTKTFYVANDWYFGEVLNFHPILKINK